MDAAGAAAAGQLVLLLLLAALSRGAGLSPCWMDGEAAEADGEEDDAAGLAGCLAGCCLLPCCALPGPGSGGPPLALAAEWRVAAL